MAANFQIHLRRKKSRIIFVPAGNLDGSSACELVQAIRSEAGKNVDVHLDTDRLRHVVPFGARILAGQLEKMRCDFSALTVTGAHAETLAI